MIRMKVYEKSKSWSSDIVFNAPTYADACVIASVLKKYGSNIGKIEMIDTDNEPEDDAAKEGSA